MPKYFLSLTIYLAGSVISFLIGYQYNNWLITAVGFLITAALDYLARKINPNIDQDVSGPHRYVKFGDLYAVTIIILAVVFVFAYYFVVNWVQAKH